MAITWRNIDIGNQGSANALLANSASTITRGLDTLANVAAQQGQTQSANWDKTSQNNTTDVISKLSMYTDPDKLLEEAKGGQFAIDKLDSTFGRQYNKAAVGDAINTKVNSLRTAAEAARLKEEAELNKKVTLEKLNRSKLMDVLGSRLTAEFGTDPALLRGKLFNAFSEMNSDGLISAAEINQTVDTFVNRVSGAGLDSNAQQTLAVDTNKATSLISGLSGAIDQAAKKYQASSGFNETVENELNDISPRAAVKDKLIQRLDKDITNVSDTDLNPLMERIDKKFSDAGLKPPTAEMMANILIEGGKHTGTKGIDLWLKDPKYVENSDIIQSRIDAVKRNQTFKETSALDMLLFSTTKAGLTEELSGAIAHNKAELEREARSKMSGGREIHTPQLKNLDAIANKYATEVGNLNRLKFIPEVDPKQEEIDKLRKELETANSRKGVVNKPGERVVTGNATVDVLNKLMPAPPPK